MKVFAGNFFTAAITAAAFAAVVVIVVTDYDDNDVISRSSFHFISDIYSLLLAHTFIPFSSSTNTTTMYFPFKNILQHNAFFLTDFISTQKEKKKASSFCPQHIQQSNDKNIPSAFSRVL